MSTKTLRKRIALVAVSAMAFGLLSTTNAFAGDAATGDISLTAAAASVNTSGVCAAGTPTASTTPETIAVGGTQEFAVAATKDTIATISGNATWSGATSASTTFDSTRTIATVTSGTAGHELYLAATTAGSFTVTFTGKAATTTTLKTYYLTVVASCTSGVSASTSFVQVTDSATKIDTSTTWLARQTQLNATQSAVTMTTTNLDTSNDVASVYANGSPAYIAVRARDAYKNNITGTNTLSINCDNGAKVNGTAFNFYSTSSFVATTDGANIAVKQAKSNVPMTTNCVVSVNGVTLATKKITFQGTVSKLVLAASRNGDAETPANGRIKYTAYDSAGNVLTSAIPTLTSGAGGTVITTLGTYSEAGWYSLNGATADYSGTSQGSEINPAYQSPGYVTFNCLNYGDQPITAYVSDASGATITSNSLTVRCGGAIDTYKATLDKDSYKPGDIATLTITAKDAGGGAVTYGTTLGAGASVALPGMTAVSAPSTSDKANDPLAGVWTYTYTVNQDATGSYAGAVKIVVASTSAQYNKPATLQYSVPTSGVSNAEVLAAIVKLIASINKQIAALQKALKK